MQCFVAHVFGTPNLCQPFSFFLTECPVENFRLLLVTHE